MKPGYEIVGAVLLTLITAFTSQKAWAFWTSRLQMNQKKQLEDKERELKYENSLEKDINDLKITLKERESNIHKMQEQILDLTKSLAAMQVRVEFLEKENNHLRMKYGRHKQ